METVEVTGKLEGVDVRIVVGEATALMGMKRAVLMSHADENIAAMGELSPSDGAIVMVAARFIYPSAVSAVVESEGVDARALSLSEFLALPEALVDAWLVAVNRLNPEWNPSRPETEEEEEQEKKG